MRSYCSKESWKLKLLLQQYFYNLGMVNFYTHTHTPQITDMDVLIMKSQEIR